MLKVLYNKAEVLSEVEKEIANTKYGDFPSWEHGLAVLQGAIRDTKSETRSVDLWMEEAWGDYQRNAFDKDIYIGIKKNALMLASEAILVAAMAQKMLDFSED